MKFTFTGKVLAMAHVCFSLTVILNLFTAIWGFNVDTSHAVIYGDDTEGKSYFGFSVGLHENTIGKYVLAGAPKANSSFDRSIPKAIESGAVFKCRITDPPGQCEEIRFLRNNDNSAVDEFRYRDLWDHSWLGGSLDVAPVSSGPPIAACAHLWKTQRYANHHLANGMCFTIDSELMTSSIKRLMPMTRHSKQALDNFTYVYSYGLAGMASHFVKDTADLAIGAPGVLNWTGTVAHVQEKEFQRPIGKQMFSIPYPNIRNADDSYVGYSVSSGSFYNDGGKMQLVAGAPRHGSAGAVFILDVPLPQDNLFTNVMRKKLEGTQMGEYFGGSVCAVDLNNDKYDDLLVGAPIHSLDVDEGVVYVFMNTKDETLLSLKTTLVGSQLGARFGSAISAIGDINQDGYQDIAIGAPYEALGGAVHIYHGSKQGPKLTQTIFASAVNSRLRGFGMSISRGLDIDENDVPDFAVGAYESGLATVLRTYPVIRLRSTIEFSIPQVNLHTANCSVGSLTTACFKLKACTSFFGQPAPYSVVLKQILSVGSRHHAESRGFLLVGDDALKSTKYDILVHANEPTCEEYDVHVLNSTKDYLTPLSFELISDIARNPRTEPKFCNNCPLINPDDTNTTIAQLSFVTNCGEDDVCHSALTLKAEVMELKGSAFVVGSSEESTIFLKVTASNNGEAAYLTMLTIALPLDVLFAKKPSNCREEMEADGSRKMLCEIGNPLPQNERIVMEFPLDMSEITTSVQELSFAFNVTTFSADDNMDDNFVTISVPVEAKADIAIIPTTDTEQVILPLERTQGNVTRNSTFLYHNFQVMKYGPSPINSVSVFLNIPNQFDDVLKPYLEIVSVEPLEGCRTISKTSSTDLNNLDMSSNTYRRTLRSFDEKTLVLDCGSSECITIVCHLGPFVDREVEVIKIGMKVFSEQLEAELTKKEEIVLISLGKVHITDQHIHQDPNEHQDLAEATTKFLKYGIPAPKEVADWIIPVCIAAGVLILLIIIAILAKVGFFRRTEKEEMDKLTKETEVDEKLLDKKEETPTPNAT